MFTHREQTWHVEDFFNKVLAGHFYTPAQNLHVFLYFGNDPSAGSPTETLLRLLLPLNDRVWIAFRPWVVVADLPGPVRKPH